MKRAERRLDAREGEIVGGYSRSDASAYGRGIGRGIGQDIGRDIGRNNAGKRYELTDLLDVGFTGVVYRARQLDLGRSVAVKLLRRELFADAERLTNSPGELAKTLSPATRVNHPHAIAVYDSGLTDDGVPFLVLELLRGRTLSDHIHGPTIQPANAALTSARAIAIAAQVLAALDQAHSVGVIHGDLTPESVVIERFQSNDDFAKVINFALATLLTAGGTPEYLAPEQIRGSAATVATDIYASGVLLYEMLAGKPPFEGASAKVILEGHLHAAPPSIDLHVPDCSTGLKDLISRALAKRPEQRPASARAMRDILSALGGDIERHQLRRTTSNATEIPLGAAPASNELPREASSVELARGSRVHATRNVSRAGRLAVRIGAAHCRIPLTGRRRERSELISFARGRDDERRCLAVVGAPGIGKSRLILEASRALGDRVPFFVAGPDHSGLRPPWSPIIDMLEQVLDIDANKLSERLATPADTAPGRQHGDDNMLRRAIDRAGLLNRDQPGLSEIFGCRGAARELELAVRRREAHAAALRALLSVHRRFPHVVLCFVDIDEYDQPSRRVLSALCDAVADTGVRLLLTARRAEEVPSGCSRLELDGLSVENTSALAHALLIANGLERKSGARLHGGTTNTSSPGDVSGSTNPLDWPRGELPSASALHTLTGGNPGAIEQLAGWLEQGNVAVGAPTQLVDLISTRVSRMPAAARRVLQAVATHGRVASREHVRALVDSPLPQRSALRSIGLLEVDDDYFQLPSTLVRSVIVACTPAHVRRALHRRALALLTGREARTRDAAVIAFHAEEAGELGLAYKSYMSAGEDAVRRFDDVGAAHRYESARRCARTREGLGVAGAADALVDAALALADVLRFTGRVGLATGVLDEAALCRPNAAQRAALMRARGRVAMSSNDLPEASRRLAEAARLAHDVEDLELMCSSYIDLSRCHDRTGDTQQAMAALTNAIDTATEGAGLPMAGGPKSLWYVGLLLAEAQLESGLFDNALRCARAALTEAQHQASARGRARLSALLARIYDRAGEPAAALRHRANAIHEMLELGDRRSTAELLIDDAIGLSQTSEPSLRKAGNPQRGLRLASRLAREIGWAEGVARSKRRRGDDTQL